MKYRSDNDKSYGAAGMVIGLNVLNAEDTFCSVTIDADGLDCVVMMPDFLMSEKKRKALPCSHGNGDCRPCEP